MEINSYGEIEDAISLYFGKKEGKEKQKLLNSIRDAVGTVPDAWDWLLEDVKINHHYIKIFSVDDQTEIIQNVIKKIKSKKEDDEFASQYQAHKLLYYASNEVVDKSLSCADRWQIRLIMDEIRKSIKWVGCRTIDKRNGQSSITTLLSRMREKRKWKQLYRKCKKNLKAKL